MWLWYHLICIRMKRMKRFSVNKLLSAILLFLFFLTFCINNDLDERLQAESITFKPSVIKADIPKPSARELDVFDFEEQFDVCVKSPSPQEMTKDKKSTKDFLSDKSLLKRMGNCQKYFEKMSPLFFNRLKNWQNDTSVPLAFAHQVHKEIGILEMFFALYFHPKDYHCIHLDAKVGGQTRKAVERIVKCYGEIFPESQGKVFIAQDAIQVFWGHMSVLDADLICLKELRLKSDKWLHASTLAGTELPIVTHKTYQTILAGLPEGESLYFSYPYPKNLLHRIMESHHLYWSGPGVHDLMLRVVSNGNQKPPPPYNLRLYKGMKNIVIHRNFINFILDDPVAQAFKEWLQDSCCPEEAFYSTLGRLIVEKVNGQNRLIQDLSPGKIRGDVCPRFSLWWSKEKCKGKTIRGICNFALEDLPRVQSSKCLVANKFSLDLDARAPICQLKSVLDLTINENQLEK